LTEFLTEAFENTEA